MKINKFLRCILVSLGLISMLFFLSPVRVALPSKSSDQTHKQLHWKSELNKKQSYNSCASYASMAYIFAKTNTKQNPETINQNITGKMSNNYTYPWGIIQYLKKHKIQTKMYYHGFLSDQNRIHWIQQKLNQDSPVIIIIGGKSYLHYITILGYKDDTFFVYDSLKDSDQNGTSVGNINMTSKELLKKWKTAVFKRMPIHLAISE